MAVSPTAPAVQASLYVGDLHQDVTESMLYDAFSEFSSIASVRVCRDSTTGRSLGYGYVNFVSPEDATRAIDVKNHSTLNGKLIRVTWSHRDPDARRSGIGNVFVKNLCDSIDSVKLQEMFQSFGNILSCKVVTLDDGKSKGYGFVQFELETSADAAIQKLNGSNVGGKLMYVGKFVKQSDRVTPNHEVTFTNLYVKNMDTSICEEVLKEKFSPYGKVVSLAISKNENGSSKGFGFVNFENPDDAKRAMEALHGSQLCSKVLYVARAQKKSEREELLRRQFEEKRREQVLKYQASNVYVKNIADDVVDDGLREHFSRCGTITSAKIMRDDKGVSKGFGFVCFSTPEEAKKAVNMFHGSVLRRKPLYVAIAQRKEERKAQLQLQYVQRMAGLAGPSAVIPGGYSPFYYPTPGVVSQIPTQPGMVYQPLGIRPGWGANSLANPSPVSMVPNGPRPQRQYRGRMNWHVLPQTGGQQPTHALHDSSNQQRGGHIKYGSHRRSREMNKVCNAAQQPLTEGSGMLSSLVAAAPPEKQKHILGDHLYPLVAQIKPDLAGKITGMLLEMDNTELLLLLDSPDSLSAKVEEAVEVFKLSKAKIANPDSPHPNYVSSQVAVN